MSRQSVLTILMLCLTLFIGVGNAWGANPTITLTQSALELTGSYSNKAEKVIDGVTFCHTDLMKSNDNIQVKASSGVLYNKTAIPGNITKIIVTHSGTARPTTVYYGTASQPSDSEKSSSFSGSSTVNVSGSNSYFKITRGSNAAYWTKVEIEYAPTPSDPYSVTLMDDNTVLTEDPAGSGVTLPSRGNCSGYTFAGWSTSNCGSSEITTPVPTIIPAGSYTPSGDENLYPVYTKIEDGGTVFDNYTKIDGGSTISSGQYLISTGTFTLTTGRKDGTSSKYAGGTSVTPGNAEYSTYEVTISGDKDEFTILCYDGYYIGDGSNSTDLKFSTSTPTTNVYKWKYTATGIQNKNTTTRYIRANGTTDYRFYTSSNGIAAFLYKRNETSGSTTYYISDPNCCTPLGTIKGSFF